MGIPQILIIILFSASLLFAANGHGKERKGKYNFWLSLVSVSIYIGVLYWGGFFKS